MVSDRSSPAVRIARCIQELPLWIFRFIEWPVVKIFGRRKDPSAIFVLALPRSGSTLAYQVICHGLQVNYLSNIWNVFYQLPLLGGAVSGRLATKHRSNFRSAHGFVAGVTGPAEGLRFWQWWLDSGLADDIGIESTEAQNARCLYLRQTFSALERWWGPFVTTFLGHSLIPDRLRAAFPSSVIIRLRRDPVANALALLNCMRSENVKWFSIKPRECEEFEDADEFRRAAAQVYWLNRRLDDAVGAEDMLTVHYEMLCEDPQRELIRIQEWCRINGIEIQQKFELPSSFTRLSARYTSDSDTRKIHAALDEMEGRFGKLAGPRTVPRGI
ncbi:sulfotransferase [Pelagerythrobacter aerophilus]